MKSKKLNPCLWRLKFIDIFFGKENLSMLLDGLVVIRLRESNNAIELTIKDKPHRRFIKFKHGNIKEATEISSRERSVILSKDESEDIRNHNYDLSKIDNPLCKIIKRKFGSPILPIGRITTERTNFAFANKIITLDSTLYPDNHTEYELEVELSSKGDCFSNVFLAKIQELLELAGVERGIPSVGKYERFQIAIQKKNDI